MRSISSAAKARAASALVAFGSVCIAHALLAQGTVTIDAEKCAHLKSPDERLECYESQINAASAQKQAVPAAPDQPATEHAAPDTRSAAPASAATAASAPVATAASAPAAGAASAPAAAAASAESAHPPSNVAEAPISAPATQNPADKSTASGSTTAPQETVGTVTALSAVLPNTWLITLDNGQVWRQTFAEQYPLRPGQRVTLRPSRWGAAFRLTADGAHGFIQVERVR
jgi:hypothetical protein